MSDFSVSIPWHVLRIHLEQELRRIDGRLRHPKEGEDFKVLQGKAQILEELLNLPNALAELEEADEVSRKEKEHGKEAPSKG